ncbi:JmjC domain-containing protein [Streptomyces kronopolitis]
MSLTALLDNPASVMTSWPKEPLLFHHDPADFADLLTLAEVDDLIDSECLPMRNLVLIKDGALIERRLFGSDEMPYPGAVRKHLDEGGTISLRQLHTVKPTLTRITRALQEETGCLVHVNAYMTPGGEQGLKYHYDPYVTLIVQVAGRKTWPVHQPIVENPMKEHGNFLERGFTHEERMHLANTPPVQSYTLEPGDVFWLPRGYLHSPYNDGDETSLHLTFAMKERTPHWVAEQMASEILEQAIVDPALRAELPPAELFGNPAAAIEEMRQYLIGALLLMNPVEMAERLQRSARRVA